MLKDIRKAKGIKQIDVANHMQVSQVTISKWENGVALPHPSKIPKLASLYGMTSDAILKILNKDA